MDVRKHLDCMIGASRTKKQYLREMLELTREQGNIIEQKDVEGLSRLIDEKQTRIDEINSLDDVFEESLMRVKQELKVNDLKELLARESNYQSHMVLLKKEVSEIMILIEDLKKLEKENSEKLTHQKGEVTKKLKEARNNKLAANRFFNSRRSVTPNPTFFDTKK